MVIFLVIFAAGGFVLIEDWLRCLLLSLLPVSELRGAIPFAIAQQLNPWLAIPLAVCGNMLVSPLAYIFLKYFHELFFKIKLYRYLFTKLVAAARRKVDKMVSIYGFWGLLLFVGIPLPITGAWTATLGAWVLALPFRVTVLAISFGVLMSAIIVSVFTLLGFHLFA